MQAPCLPWPFAGPVQHEHAPRLRRPCGLPASVIEAAETLHSKFFMNRWHHCSSLDIIMEILRLYDQAQVVKANALLPLVTHHDFDRICPIVAQAFDLECGGSDKLAHKLKTRTWTGPLVRLLGSDNKDRPRCPGSQRSLQPVSTSPAPQALFGKAFGFLVFLLRLLLAIVIFPVAQLLGGIHWLAHVGSR